MDVINAMVVWQLGKPCFSKWFCSACRGRTCLICCPDHAARHHHADAGVGLLGIDMLSGRPTLLSRQVKLSNLGFDWRKIQRKKVSGQKRIFLHRQPADRRLKDSCKNCGDKVMHKPNGQNADVLQDLVNIDFGQESVRDVFCLLCLRAFASAHCADHVLHHGADVEAAGAVPFLVEIVDHGGWKLVAADVVGQSVGMERLKRILVNGVQMVAVCRRHVQAHSANSCASVSCHESVDQAGDICSLECWFHIHILANEEADEEDDEDDEEPQTPPQDSDEDEDQD